MDVLRIVQAIGGLFVLVALVASTLAYYRVQKSEATIEILNETNTAQEKRLNEYQAAAVDRDKDFEKLRTRLDASVQENRLLRDMVTGRDALAELTQRVTDLARDTSRRYETLTAQHNQIIAMLGGRRDGEH